MSESVVYTVTFNGPVAGTVTATDGVGNPYERLTVVSEDSPSMATTTSSAPTPPRTIYDSTTTVFVSGTSIAPNLSFFTTTSNAALGVYAEPIAYEFPILGQVIGANAGGSTTTFPIASLPATSSSEGSATSGLVTLETRTTTISESSFRSSYPPYITKTLQPISSGAAQTQVIPLAYVFAGGTSTSSSRETDVSSPGLSTGAKIGIGVAVPLAVLVIGAIAGVLFYRRRYRGNHPMPSQNMHFPEAKVFSSSSTQEPQEAVSDLPVSYGPQEPVSAVGYGPQEPARALHSDTVTTAMMRH